MDTICIIPARFNSGRFPGKLLKLALGKTVLQRTLECALNCKALDAVFVATDDEKIAHHIQSLGVEVIWTSSKCKNGTERILDALHVRPDLQSSQIVVNLQGDHPCTSQLAITSVVNLLKNDQGASMSTAATPLKDPIDFRSPHVVKCVFDRHFNALYFSRAPIPHSWGEIPKNAYHHIGLYAYRTPFLLSMENQPQTQLQIEEDLEQLQAMEMGYRIKVAPINEVPIGVDTPQDLEKLEKYLTAIT